MLVRTSSCTNSQQPGGTQCVFQFDWSCVHDKPHDPERKISPIWSPYNRFNYRDSAWKVCRSKNCLSISRPSAVHGRWFVCIEGTSVYERPITINEIVLAGVLKRRWKIDDRHREWSEQDGCLRVPVEVCLRREARCELIESLSPQFLSLALRNQKWDVATQIIFKWVTVSTQIHKFCHTHWCTTDVCCTGDAAYVHEGKYTPNFGMKSHVSRDERRLRKCFFLQNIPQRRIPADTSCYALDDLSRIFVRKDYMYITTNAVTIGLHHIHNCSHGSALTTIHATGQACLIPM